MRKILCFLAAFLSFTSLAGDYEIRLDMSTCEPDGMVNSLRERSDRKTFWISQSVSLEMSLSRMGDGFLSDCMRILDQSEKLRCVEYKRNLRASVARCYSVANRRCREYGGFCG